MPDVGIEGRFFEEFALCGLFGGLVGVQETTGEGKAAQEGDLPALDEQQLEALIPDGEHGDVCRDPKGGVGLFFEVFQIRCHTGSVLYGCDRHNH